MSRTTKPKPRQIAESLQHVHPHDRILLLLRTQGEKTAAQLAIALGITSEAVRQQLLILQQQGFVRSAPVIHGVGRPVQRWTLTQKANQRFPNSTTNLLVQLVQNIRKTFGEPALERLIEARRDELLANYKGRLQGTTDLKQKLKSLVAIRNSEGYMAELHPKKNEFLLIENHCPICASTGVCLKLCRAESNLLEKLLGPKVAISHQEFSANGSRRTVYHIKPNPRN
jgi:predicted ArsR family transcriptional regulator